MHSPTPLSLPTAANLPSQLGRLRLLLLDVDGVLTSGSKRYGPDGSCSYKDFCDIDFTAIKRFRAAGVDVGLVSGDRFINERLSQNRCLPFWFSRGQCKSEILPDILKSFSLTQNDVSCFVGDDLFDLEIMKATTISACPSLACLDILQHCSASSTGITLSREGGRGCIDELFAYYQFLNPSTVSISDVYQLDAKETF